MTLKIERSKKSVFNVFDTVICALMMLFSFKKKIEQRTGIIRFRKIIQLQCIMIKHLFFLILKLVHINVSNLLSGTNL